MKVMLVVIVVFLLLIWINCKWFFKVENERFDLCEDEIDFLIEILKERFK